MKRNFGFDNIKAILILLVILGHLLEICGGFSVLYRIIYLFHMPVFIFISGYFAKFGWKKLLDKVWMYGLFQVLYIWFERCVKPAGTPFQFKTPYWILWYLFVMICYTALIPLYQVNTGRKRALVVGISVLFSIGVGFIEQIGYTFSLSRFFVFQPYFLLGLYAKEQRIAKISNWTFWGCLAGAIFSVGVIFLSGATDRMLYGSGCYHVWTDAFLRLLLVGVACVWIGLFWGLKDRICNKISVVSTVGRNTLPIYLLHGFLMRAASFCHWTIPRNILLILLMAAIILVVLGNDYVAKSIQWLMPSRLKNLKKHA